MTLDANRHIGADTPNVKDEPRPRPARLLRPSIAHSVVSFDSSFVSRRRDGRGRWLWRLVRPFFHPMEPWSGEYFEDTIAHRRREASRLLNTLHTTRYSPLSH